MVIHGFHFSSGSVIILAENKQEAKIREIGPDEFNPVGTAALLVVYFLILVLMWIFMYFVEFLGGGPTVIGI